MKRKTESTTESLHPCPFMISGAGDIWNLSWDSGPRPRNDQPSLHPNVTCCGCGETIGNGIRWKCSICGDFDFCGRCEESVGHMDGTHPFVKIKDSRSLKAQTLMVRLCSCPSFAPCICEMQHRDHDAYAFSKSHPNIDHDEGALSLIRRMLRKEHQLRWSETVQDAYRSANGVYGNGDSGPLDKTTVTDRLQHEVVNEFLSEGRSLALFHNLDQGILFLRSAVGNFPSHLSELRSCAKYVDLTQRCRRGALRVGDVLTETVLASIKLTELGTGAQVTLLDECRSRRCSSVGAALEPDLEPTFKDPLVIIASSSS